ncbi:MAG TPA: anti-sigma factor [Miltoncostaea sp.]|jgi:anti-sigma factor RsiW|nr:anti-sigma factor [Miltoncostaea sp.]
MTREHDVLRDLIAPVALGAAAPHEIARVEAHAKECAVCGEELAALRSAADVLAVAVPQHDPPPSLKDALMSTVRAEAAERAGEEPAEAPARPRERRRRRFLGMPAWPAAAALATIVALALAIGLVRSTSGGSDDGRATTIAMTAGPAAPDVTGTVLYVPDQDTAVVELSDLPPLKAGDAYQLWIVRNGTPTSAGLFASSGPAEARTVATGLQDGDALAVTAQPATSRTAPQGPILVQAPL